MPIAIKPSAPKLLSLAAAPRAAGAADRPRARPRPGHRHRRERGRDDFLLDDHGVAVVVVHPAVPRAYPFGSGRR